MKKFTKITAVVLALLMALSCLTVGAFAVTYRDVRSTTPIILMRGQGATIYNAQGEIVYPVTVPEGYVDEAFDTCIPLFKDAISTGDYSEWSDALVGYVANIYKDIQLDCNGENSKGDYILECQYTDAQIYERAGWYRNAYSSSSFDLAMDWRLDPFENAEYLKHRIEVVKAATGAEKVAVVARCEACSVLATYLEVYGTDDIESAVFYTSTLGGLDAVSGFFSGNFDIDADALVEFYENQDLFEIEDEATNALINNTIGFMQEIYGLDVACAMLMPIRTKLYKEAIYKCVLNSYGTFPGIWTLVTAEDYEDARDGVFAGVEEEYAGLIEKLDRYHERVGSRYEEILKNAEKDGVNIAVVAKYGDYMMYPVCKDNQAINDGSLSLGIQSLGATTADRGTTLSDSYLAKAKKNGTDKYIAVDNMVDASTCMFPDTTWFICNNVHKDFTKVGKDLTDTFIASGGTMTVDTNPDYPQYLYLEGTDESNYNLVPLTEENCMQPDEEENLSPSQEKQSMKEKVFAFLKSLFTMILRLFNNYEKTGSLFG